MAQKENSLSRNLRLGSPIIKLIPFIAEILFTDSQPSKLNKH